VTAASRLPVIIGVGQLRNNREKTVEAAREPADLIADAVRRALADSGAGDAVLARVQRLDLVRVIGWDYDDLPGEVASRLGIAPRQTDHSEIGGNRPPLLVDRAAAAIAAGEIDVAVVAGAEAAASLGGFAKAGIEPPWSRRPGGPVRFGRELAGSEYNIRHRLSRPIRGYPIYENALRAALGQTFAESQSASAEMYAEFSRIAATHEAAWNPTPVTAEEVATVTARNRMICFPYPLLMNALGAVDQAAAVVIASLTTARELGVAEEKLAYVWGGAGGADSRDLLERVSYSRSPAMEAALDATLAQAGIAADQLEAVDLYSCFPVVPKLAAAHLKLPSGVPLSLTGGLTSFGGPGNNYSTHAIANAVVRIRAGAANALVHGNGEIVTKHHAIMLGRAPHPEGHVGRLDPVTPAGGRPPGVVEQASGAATIEAYTVEYDRSGEPLRAVVVGRTTDGSRFVANAPDGDRATLDALVDVRREAVGRTGEVAVGDDGRNLFRLADGG
jgi:acetyl-CoA C-acetyltransferase